MSLSDRLNDLADAGSNIPQAAAAPAGWSPGVVYQPDGSRLVTLPPTPALADEASWAAAVESLGVSVPDGFRCRLVEAKFDPVAWTRDSADQNKAITKAVWRYRFIIEVAPSRIDIDDLLKAVKKQTPKTQPASADVASFVFACGDLQLGKPDGDGSAGTVQRFYDSLERSVTRYKALKKRGQVGPVVLPWLGDCIEGTESQGGNLIARLDLTVTEMVRVYRRLLAEQVSAFATITDDVTVSVVPGNHDEAKRVGNQMATRYDDSWAIEGASQVADVMAAKGYEIKWLFPDKDGLHVTLDVQGTRIGLLHGHQTRGKMQTWLANKAMSRDAIGTADVVLSGHFHHLRLEQMGPTTWMQTGALDGNSTWWAHKGGLDAPPAALTFITAGGVWSGLEIV
jgi:predicted phosphodiesterase